MSPWKNTRECTLSWQKNVTAQTNSIYIYLYFFGSPYWPVQLARACLCVGYLLTSNLWGQRWVLCGCFSWKSIVEWIMECLWYGDWEKNWSHWLSGFKLRSFFFWWCYDELQCSKYSKSYCVAEYPCQQLWVCFIVK